jgi:hypothetical protein
MCFESLTSRIIRPIQPKSFERRKFIGIHKIRKAPEDVCHTYNRFEYCEYKFCASLNFIFILLGRKTTSVALGKN